jgi:predicted NACHT family NTPase
LPYVISDIMEPLEQVDGKFYSSKRAFRAVGRALGLTEVGTEKLKPKVRASSDRAVKDARRETIKTAIAKVKAGTRR